MVNGRATGIAVSFLHSPGICKPGASKGLIRVNSCRAEPRSPLVRQKTGSAMAEPEQTKIDEAAALAITTGQAIEACRGDHIP